MIDSPLPFLLYIFLVKNKKDESNVFSFICRHNAGTMTMVEIQKGTFPSNTPPTV